MITGLRTVGDYPLGARITQDSLTRCSGESVSGRPAERSRCAEIVAPERILTACSGLRDTLNWGLQLSGGEP
jgi:hypothetical protein